MPIRNGIEISDEEWRIKLLAKKWAISGHGTVFDQNKPGIVPTILAIWY
jgi:hypothetical protein